MIVHDFDGHGIAFAPQEAQPPLVVDPDAVLPGAVTLQGFKLVAGRDAQEVQCSRRVQLLKLAQRNLLDIREAFDPATVEQIFSVRTFKGQDQVVDSSDGRY